ncbi:MAG: IPT/TIG domain-containing protein [Cyclobacteriaceae bacterium]
MKITKHKAFKLFTFSLIWVVSMVFLSCEEDKADKISISEQKLPTITTINPSIGVLHTNVTITGTNFSSSKEDVSVTFNGTEAVISESSETSITAVVPSGATTGLVGVKIGASFVQGGPTFTVPEPTVDSYSPTTGIVGTEVVVTGTNFSTVLADNSISFNGETADITGVTSTTITTSVPSGATTGPISVTVDGQTGVAGVEFTVPLPTINSFDPIEGETDAVVTITGTNFSADIDNNEVRFNGVEAVVTSATETTIVTSVPAGASTGTITVVVGGQEVTSTDNFTVLATTLLISLTSNDDDVEEIAVVDPDPDPLEPTPVVGTMDLGSSDLEFGEISSDQGLMSIGLRYNDVTIPAGAVVTEASIQFNADNTGADPVELTIYGENVGDAAAYDEAINGNLSSRPLTTANAVWSIPEWVSKGDRGDAQKTVDIAAIIQEIIDRGDWASGNSINIIMIHSGVSLNGAKPSSGGREAENYSDSDPEHGAELKVVFTQ